MLVHFEHADPVLAAEDLLQLVVCNDFPLVLRILQVVLANVIPDLRNHLAARKRSAAGDRSEIRRRLTGRASPPPALRAPCAIMALLLFSLWIERKPESFAMPLQSENRSDFRGRTEPRGFRRRDRCRRGRRTGCRSGAPILDDRDLVAAEFGVVGEDVVDPSEPDPRGSANVRRWRSRGITSGRSGRGAR